MSSLLTNTAAMTALQTLRSVNASLETTQNRISTGYRVATASDNSAYWSIATTMRSDNAALSAVSDALGLGSATISTQYTALVSTVGTDSTGLTALKAKLVAAKEPGVDRQKIQAEISSIQNDLKNTSDLAVFNGENWLSVDSTAPTYNSTKSVVSSFSRAGGVVKINTINVNIDTIKLYDKTGVVGTVQTGTTAGTFAAAAGNVTVTVGANPAVNVAVTANSTLQDIADGINALHVANLSVVVDKTANQLKFASRDTVNTIAIDSTVVGLGTTNLAVAATASKKGILDKNYDYYDGTAWKTTTVGTIDISKLTDSAADTATLDQYISAVDTALASVTKASADLGATKTRITSNQDFISKLKDSIDSGVGQLVDADMNAESTKLQAEQVQQQLATQALSIANARSQSILSLFRS
jgi:flagellin